MKPKLKALRAHANLTQKTVAAAVGVAQSVYREWEAGAEPIPDDKVAKVAKALKTTPDAVRGRHRLIEVHLAGGDGVDPEHVYYGEVAVHFKGGSRPLLLSISDEAFSSLHHDLQVNSKFVCVETLANQTVLINMSAIADVYFSSEAYDDFGPEHDTYDRSGVIQIPDPYAWEIIERLGGGWEDLPDHDPRIVEAVKRMLGISDAGPDAPSAAPDGGGNGATGDGEAPRQGQDLHRIFALATDISYQLSGGVRRDVTVFEPDSLSDEVGHVFLHPESAGDGLLHFDHEGGHRIVFVNPHALDYLTVPTHLLERSSVESLADMIDEEGTDASAPVPPRSARQGTPRTGAGRRGARRR